MKKRVRVMLSLTTKHCADCDRRTLQYLQAFMKKCQEVSFQVLSCFALGLGFEEDFFTKVNWH